MAIFFRQVCAVCNEALITDEKAKPKRYQHQAVVYKQAEVGHEPVVRTIRTEQRRSA